MYIEYNSWEGTKSDARGNLAPPPLLKFESNKKKLKYSLPSKNLEPNKL